MPSPGVRIASVPGPPATPWAHDDGMSDIAGWALVLVYVLLAAAAARAVLVAPRRQPSAAAAAARPRIRSKSPAATASAGVSQDPPTQETVGSAR